MSHAGALPPDVMLQHAGSIRALALSILGDEHAADDVLQETWVRALKRPPARHDSIGGWLRRVAEGIAISRLRSEGRRRHRETNWAEDRDCLHSSYDATERADVLRSVVDEVLALDEPYRETVMRRYFEGLPPREIAAATNTSVATVNSRLQRAQARLRERLDRRLSDRCGGMRGALLALVGWREEAAAAVGAGWVGSGFLLKTAIGTAGVAAVVALAVLFTPREPAALPTDPLAARTGGAAPLAAIEQPGKADARSAASPPAVVGDPTAASRARVAPPLRPGPYAFDVAFEPIDALGRPLAECDVWIGPDPGLVAPVGRTAWDGALRLAWRGDEPEARLLVTAARAGHGSTPLRSVRVRAGAPQVVRLGLDHATAAVPAELDLARKAVLADVDELSRGRARRAEGAFALDAAGNGVFTDPWLVEAQGELEPVLDVIEGRHVTSIGVGSAHAAAAGYAEGETGTAIVIARVTGPDGRPAAATWTIAAARGGFREDHSAANGETWFTGLFAGAHELLVTPAGREMPIVRKRVVLAAGEQVAVDLAFPSPPESRVRVFDAEGAACAGWRVELRDEDGSTLVRATLDAEGRAALPAAGTAPARLLVRREDAGIAEVIADPLLPQSFEQVFRALQEPHAKTLRVVVRGARAAQASVRVVRADSGDALEAAPVDDPEIAGEGARAFRARGLPAGEYRVVVGAPACGWRGVRHVRLEHGRGPEVVDVDLDTPAELRLARGEAAWLRLATARQGMRVVSDWPYVGPQTRLRAATGAFVLYVEREGEAETVEPVQLAPGALLSIE